MKRFRPNNFIIVFGRSLQQRFSYLWGVKFDGGPYSCRCPVSGPNVSISHQNK